MRQRAAGIIIKDGKILLLYRRREGNVYYIVPGGGIEEGETPEQAAIREIKEETNLDVEIDRLFFEFDGTRNSHEYFFTVKNIQGEACLGGEELEKNSEENYYEVAWVQLSRLPEINLLPGEVREKLIKTL
jgi:8-oxo-dGTP pyrophosphatase MutT (NUDIX family)